MALRAPDGAFVVTPTHEVYRVSSDRLTFDDLKAAPSLAEQLLVSPEREWRPLVSLGGEAVAFLERVE